MQTATSSIQRFMITLTLVLCLLITVCVDQANGQDILATLQAVEAASVPTEVPQADSLLGAIQLTLQAVEGSGAAPVAAPTAADQSASNTSSSADTVLLSIQQTQMAATGASQQAQPQPTAEPAAQADSQPFVQPPAQQDPAEIRRTNDIQIVGVQMGNFIMGSRNHHDENKPAHNVYLDTFYIMIHETTGQQYTACVDAGFCSPSTNPVGGQYPQTNVTWYQAVDFCSWIGGSLPTEAQWEKAARGINGNPYPWGTEIDYDDKMATILADNPSIVGSRPKDVSPYGVYDMGGNLNEWCSDWYDPEYYKHSPDSNPTGPESGESKVVRGGAYNRDYTMVYIRKQDSKFTPDIAKPYVGFRCVVDQL